ncbi:unnamed protein product [Trichogramma brassicae]|uniref:Uncharacterized protein n=1 Tax=Trichogramma brassicae TaxID=86971 RepID=A0A6H5HW67_9HYME|nr:unnamed protein product [Trichogramma brassicae]
MNYTRSRASHRSAQCCLHFEKVPYYFCKKNVTSFSSTFVFLYVMVNYLRNPSTVTASSNRCSRNSVCLLMVSKQYEEHLVMRYIGLTRMSKAASADCSFFRIIPLDCKNT